jgi:hypothetical protein
MAALRTPLFLLALLAGAAFAAAQYTEVAPGDASTSAIFQKAGPKTAARTLPGSQCQVCKPGGNCYPDALGAGTQSITCTGPCDSCPSGCAFGEPFPFTFNNQVIYLTPCGCPDAGELDIPFTEVIFGRVELLRRSGIIGSLVSCRWCHMSGRVVSQTAGCTARRLNCFSYIGIPLVV